MVKHLVMWRLKEEAEGRSREENALLIKEKLEALAGQIPGLLAIEVGIDISRTPDSADIVLYSEFTDRDALAAYHHHPAHKAVAPLVGAARSGRQVVDYEVKGTFA